MKQILDKFSVLTIALIISGLTLTACTSSKSGGNSNEPATGAAQQTAETAKNKQETVKETPKETTKPTAEKSAEPDVSGKYQCCETGVEGEYSLELKANNAAAYKEKHEDSDSLGKGSWSWDKNKESINVNLNVETESYGGENPEVSQKSSAKVTFKLKKDGRNLQIVDETLSQLGSEGYYIGKTFKKL